MKDLRLTRERIDECIKIGRLSIWFWLFLVAVHMATWLLINDELADVWSGAVTFMTAIAILDFAILTASINIFAHLYRYNDLELSMVIILNIMLLGIIVVDVIGCSKNLPKFIQLCQIAPSHLGFIIPLGLVIEYSTYVGCMLVRVLLDWRADRRSWRMVKAMIEHNTEGDEPYSNSTDGANTAVDGQLSFATFVSHFN